VGLPQFLVFTSRFCEMCHRVVWETDVCVAEETANLFPSKNVSEVPTVSFFQ
jgi:hypothetical protein